MKIHRRRFNQGLAALTAVAATPLVRAADVVRIGYVSPQTGALASFGETDKWVIEQMKAAFKEGLTIGGCKYEVQVLLKDSQSNPNRAGEVANDLILKDKVALLLTAGTPETAIPVSDAAELNEIPCISSVVPWQPWFFGRKGNPETGFGWTYHFFWGLEDVIATFTNGWKSVQTNKKVGALFPNDGDGNAWGDKNLGFPKPLAHRHRVRADRPGRCVASHAHDGLPVRRPHAAAVCVRGRDHRRHGLFLGDAGRRDVARHHPAGGLQARSRLGHLVFLAILLWRPQGLMPKTRG